MIFRSITCTLMVFFVNYVRLDGFLCNVSKLRNATDVFAQKKFLEDIFNFEICYRYDLLVIGPRVAQFRK